MFSLILLMGSVFLTSAAHAQPAFSVDRKNLETIKSDFKSLQNFLISIGNNDSRDLFEDMGRADRMTEKFVAQATTAYGVCMSYSQNLGLEAEINHKKWCTNFLDYAFAANRLFTFTMSKISLGLNINRGPGF